MDERTPSLKMNEMRNVRWRLVHQYIEKIMLLIERPADGLFPYPYLSATYGEYYPNEITCWDVHHMAMRFAYSGKPDYFKYLIDNLLHYQTSDGFTPAAINCNGPHHYFPRFHAHPFLMQGALMYVSLNKDIAWAKDRFRQLKLYLTYYEKNNSAPHGLFRWTLSWMGGIDNDVATTFFHPETIISVDINAWMYLEYRAAAILASRLGKKSDVSLFAKKAKRLRRAINDILWYDQVDSYSAYNLVSDEHQFHLGLGTECEELGYYAFQSCSNLIPLYARIADQERSARMIKKYVLNEEHFLSPYGIRSLSKSSPYYNNAIWGNPPRFGEHHRMTNSNWQGPVWIPLCYFMFHALLSYGFKQEARHLAERTIEVLALSLKKIGSFAENYDAETGKPLFATSFTSWNILADVMYEEMDSNKWIMEPIFDKKLRVDL